VRSPSLVTNSFQQSQISPSEAQALNRSGGKKNKKIFLSMGFDLSGESRKNKCPHEICEMIFLRIDALLMKSIKFVAPNYLILLP
jgi:hypothetical protein